MRAKLFVVLLVSILIFSSIGCPMSKKQINHSSKDNSFKIVFWGHDVASIEELLKLEFNESLLKSTPHKMVEDKDILNYYWDEQFIEIDNKSVDGKPGFPINIGGQFFSILLNNKVVFHGLNKTGLNILVARKLKYDDSNYPAMTSFICTNDKNAILALKPKYFPMLAIFRKYDEKEQKRILYPEVLEYFEKQGKIVRGTIDLGGLLRDYDTRF